MYLPQPYRINIITDRERIKDHIIILLHETGSCTGHVQTVFYIFQRSNIPDILPTIRTHSLIRVILDQVGILHVIHQSRVILVTTIFIEEGRVKCKVPIADIQPESPLNLRLGIPDLLLFIRLPRVR